MLAVTTSQSVYQAVLSDPEHPAANSTYVVGQLYRGQLLKFKAKVDFIGYQMWGFNTKENETSGHA